MAQLVPAHSMVLKEVGTIVYAYTQHRAVTSRQACLTPGCPQKVQKIFESTEGKVVQDNCCAVSLLLRNRGF